ncbi:hypothetical protein EWM64_g8810 [Hericium alpestre]|uniref:RNase H type-1 domain-containing protein n=1 Tax=Hericium alpestre TaxID=135208 RepID=A0A4Y9ZKD3_9AGAM|nr:hypothetical protein EWM64_g8810 [Hericium alpestre]
MAFGSGVNVTIVCLNVHGDLLLKLCMPAFVSWAFSHDILVLQETHLVPEQHDSLPYLASHSCLPFSRPASSHFCSQGGGVLVFVHHGLPFHVRPDFCEPDLTVVNFDSFLLIAAYVPLPSSPWHAHSLVSPFSHFEEVVSSCAASMRPLLVLGDLNACIGLSSPALGAARRSADHVLNTRGRHLLALCHSALLTVLNGSPTYDCSASCGSFTSFQPLGRVLVDYALLSSAAHPLLHAFSVPLQVSPWSDHAPLHLTLALPLSELRRPLPTRCSLDTSFLLPPSDLDALFRGTIAATCSLAEALAALYGPCLHDSASLHVYTDGSAVSDGTNAMRADAGVLWGLDSPRNASLRIPGLQTNNRGELYAVLAALDGAPPHRSLVLSTDSQYVIHSLCHWAADLAQSSWQCVNANLISACVTWLQSRCCPTNFVWIKGHVGNILHNACDALTFAGMQLPPVVPDMPALLLPTACDHPCTIRPLLQKAFTALPRQSVPRATTAGLVVPWVDPHAAAHRGRARFRQQQQDNLQHLVACESDATFWCLICDWTDTKARPLQVPLAALREVFVGCMNPPRELPAPWNAATYLWTRRLCRALPPVTRVAGNATSRRLHQPFSEDDVAAGKHHLCRHRADSAAGFDGTAYSDLMAIPNNVLSDLCRTCIAKGDVPHEWLLTYIVAILKHGRPARDPESYHVIGLESCFLKFLTLLIEFRFRTWAEESDMLPASQNGFCHGFHTNNNAFVLRCAIDVARCQCHPLYTVFVDLMNAFPSTDHPALWLKLFALGAGGPLFDFMRVLYSRMQYVVRADGTFSAPFMSGHGILAGDSASPMFWLLFMADLRLSDDPADISLNGVYVSHLEHADDIVLFSTSPAALQRKLNMLALWCSINFLAINLRKSIGMVFGCLPPRLPVLYINGSALCWTSEYTYVGVSFCSTKCNIFAPHYSSKAHQAKSLASAMFGLDGLIGSLPA